MAQKHRNNIILIGFSFTGKSSVAQIAARRIGWKFVDLDEEIIELAGKSIPEIFAQDGEVKFRSLEKQVLKKACGSEHQVIATGGGVILKKENRSLMKRCGMIICLQAKPETIYQRLLKASKESSNTMVRPLLTGDNPLAKIKALKEQRQEYYNIAHMVIKTDDLNIEQVAGEVIQSWNNWIKATVDYA